MSNWNIPRDKVVSLTVDLVRNWRWGDLSILSASDDVARKHYIGRCPRQGARLLARDAMALFWSRYAGRTVSQERELSEITEMEKALCSEGWRILDPHGNEFLTGYMWTHTATGVCINRNGGLYDTFEEATRVAFGSVTREMMADGLGGDQ